MQKISDILSDKIQGIIALIIILSGFAFLIWANAPETINGRVEDLMFLVGTFYFGSSKSGAGKDVTISSLAQSQQQSISDHTNIAHDSN